MCDRELPLGEKVHHLDRRSERRGATRHTLAETEGCSSKQLDQLRFDLVARPKPERARGVVVLVDHAAAGPGELDGATYDGGEHGLKIERGAHGPPDLAQRLQFVHRASQLPGPHLELGEQPHVFDGDDGLVGERGHQVDLLVGEGLDPDFPQKEDAEECAFAQHRDPQRRPVADLPLKFGHFVLGVGRHVRDVDRPALKSGPARDRPSPWRERGGEHDIPNARGRPVVGGQAKHVAVKSEDRPCVSAAEPGRVLDESLQDRLEPESGGVP
jgi:hypothetical protein